MVDTSRLEYLLKCYFENRHTPCEEDELMALLANSDNQEAIKQFIDRFISETGPEIKMNPQSAAAVLKNVLQQGAAPGISHPRKIISLSWMRVAAAVLLVIAATYLYRQLLHKPEMSSQQIVSNEQPTSIEPGGNKALLTTSDGSSINLDSIQDGTVITKGSAKISKREGLLVYDITASSAGNDVIENTLSTPRGGQYQVVLADGTKVWLNAASSLRFPSDFPGGQRVVELAGEAYFEVAKDKHKPFLVKVGRMEVNVLGTHFNVNAYAEEKTIKTSLLEGSVKITNGTASSLLQPGEQAVLRNADNKVRINRVNMDKVVAWKNGVFQFDDADITVVMREIARWYNVEIVYTGNVPTRQFEGKISRNAELIEVLKILELSGVKCTIAGNKIEVR
jgi:hypothetical protein